MVFKYRLSGCLMPGNISNKIFSNKRWLSTQVTGNDRKSKKNKNKNKNKESELTAVVGLEIHARIKSDSKIFSGGENCFGKIPNSSVRFLDASLPGSLPVLNKKCVEAAVMTGLAFNAKINPVSYFDRKHYFYPDMPNGYQITQHKRPIVTGGFVTIAEPTFKKIPLERLHLEQDSGKSIHDTEMKTRLIDLNRCGVGLMEIVTEPVIRSGEEAYSFIREFRDIVKQIGTCDSNMYEGSMRVDANVSMHYEGTEFGTRVEIKNVNGSKNLRDSINYEIKRQSAILKKGERVERETRNYDMAKKVTESLRDKEKEKDYRYMPEPDLKPLCLTEEYISQLKDSLPVLPAMIIKRLVDTYGISEYQANILFKKPEALDFFEKSVTKDANGPTVAQIFIGNIFKLLKELDVNIDAKECLIKTEHLAAIADAVADNKLSIKNVDEVLKLVLRNPNQPVIEIISENNLMQINDPKEISEFCRSHLESNQKFQQYILSDNEKMMGPLVGMIIAASKGRITHKSITETLITMKKDAHRDN